jgi:hypothetical protein
MPSIIEGYNYDIFISYRQKDNKHDGWVTEFVDNLKGELESMFKDEVSVYFDINPSNYLLESYDVDASLKDKLKCLIFIPIISRTYCDPKSFAWENELKAFIEKASVDRFGFKIKLPGGNVANRVLPIRIHDLDSADIKLFESVVGGVLRSIDFVYKESGVNRQLKERDDNIIKSPNQIFYRDQINKVALTIKEIIESMKYHAPTDITKQKAFLPNESEEKKETKVEKLVQNEIIKPENVVSTSQVETGKKQRFQLSVKHWILIPGILASSVILSGFIFFLNHQSKIKWAKEVALPQIEQLANGYKMDEAFTLSQKAGKYISKNEKFKELVSTFTTKISIVTDPVGAEVLIREFTDTPGAWKNLGQTPIRQLQMPKHSYYLMKIEKPGYESVEGVLQTRIDTVFRKLFKEGTIPSGMVYVYGYQEELTNNYLKPKNGFFIDRYEVTNKQYKDFIDNGGYKKPEFWKNTFIKDGKMLSFQEALAEFTDKTGQPGPPAWIAGDYPDGQDDYPVSGISWYEAAAYAEFARKELPTVYHWASASGFNFEAFGNYFYSKLFPFSNFKGVGPEPVGINPGITCFGASDMAGNTREWCWNMAPGGRIVRGGGWDDVVYMYGNISQLPPFNRSPKNGFRCVKYIDREKIPQTAFQPYVFVEKRDYLIEKPVDEATFRIYRNRFLYDKRDLETVIESRDSSFQDWTVEKISFNAAYNNERIIVYLFLPRKILPPYQTLIFFPGSNATTSDDFNNNYWANWFTDFILKSGRAVVYPVYKGTFERKNSQEPIVYQGYQYADWLIKWVKDFSRSVDYLMTRPDINTEKLGYYGHSWGARLGSIIPAVEGRLKVSILVVGGLPSSRRVPEADELNYLPYVKIPVLMLNGKYDMAFPYETTVKPFFELLGTQAKDKHIRIYETDHYVPKNEMIKEVLSFLDNYLGPVK